MTKYIILWSLDNVLKHQHVPMPIACDILTNLHEMFGAKGKSTRQTTLKTIINAKMPKETLVRNYLICMIGLFNEIEILRVEIDGKTQVDMVLKTFSDSFKQLKLNYCMNKMVMSLTKLIKEL